MGCKFNYQDDGSGFGSCMRCELDNEIVGECSSGDCDHYEGEE